jgi:hypothetical protein
MLLSVYGGNGIFKTDFFPDSRNKNLHVANIFGEFFICCTRLDITDQLYGEIYSRLYLLSLLWASIFITVFTTTLHCSLSWAC